MSVVLRIMCRTRLRQPRGRGQPTAAVTSSASVREGRIWLGFGKGTYLILITILIFQAAEGLLRIDAPFTEPAACGRSTVNAMFARNYYEDGFNFFLPRLDYGAPPGYAVQEFPLLPYGVALLYPITGVEEWVARAVPLTFGIGTTILTFVAAALRYRSAQAALVAAFVMALSPMIAFFTRTFQSDSAMLFFLMLAVVMLLWARGMSTYIWRLLAAVSAAISLLLKPSTAVLLPMLLFLLNRTLPENLGRGERIRTLTIFLGISVLPTVLFYWYAEHLNSFGNMGILAVADRAQVSHILNFAYYVQLFKDFLQAVTPAGMLALGAAAATMMVRRVVDWLIVLWAGGVAALLIVFNEAIAHHEYYQMIWVPLASLAAAQTVDFLRRRERRWTWYVRVVVVLVVATTVAASVALHWEFMKLRLKFPPEAELRVEAGAWLRAHTPEDAIVVSVASPDVLYYAHRRGWFVEGESGGTSDPTVLRRICTDGCDYFVSVRGGRELSQEMRQLLDHGGLVHTRGDLRVWRIDPAQLGAGQSDAISE